MFRRWSSTDADRSGTACRPDTNPHARTSSFPPTTTTTNVRHRHRCAAPPSHYVMALGAILVFAIAPPSACHAKQARSKSGLVDALSWPPTNSSSSGASLLHRQQRPPAPPNTLQETKWPPVPSPTTTRDEDVLDLTDHHKRRRHQRPSTAVNRTTISVYDRMVAATERRNRQRDAAAPKRTMPHYLAILSGEEPSPASSTRWREVNDTAVRPPRLYPLRPAAAPSAEDYFGGDDDLGDEEDLDEDGDELELFRPNPSRGGGGGGDKRGGPRRETGLKSSKDALIVTKKSYLKKDWCKTELLVQRVREAGCLTRRILNRFCYGQCNSFYIPKNTHDEREMDATAFKSCAFCKPKRFRWITITLHCPGQTPPIKKKRIQRIKKCKCISEILQ